LRKLSDEFREVEVAVGVDEHGDQEIREQIGMMPDA
jgi:hypothetical protein